MRAFDKLIVKLNGIRAVGFVIGAGVSTAFWDIDLAERQIAALLAFARVYELVAQDDAVDLLHQFIGAKLLRAEHTGERERLRTLRDLDASALRLREIGLIVLDPLHADAELRTAIFARIPREQLEKDLAARGRHIFKEVQA